MKFPSLMQVDVLFCQQDRAASWLRRGECGQCLICCAARQLECLGLNIPDSYQVISTITISSNDVRGRYAETQETFVHS